MSVTSDWLTVPEVAAIYRCHEKTVRRMIRRGELPATFVAGRWLIDRDDTHRPERARPLPPRRLPGPAAGPVTELVRQMEAS